jgi:hypothetical protein
MENLSIFNFNLILKKFRTQYKQSFKPGTIQKHTVQSLKRVKAITGQKQGDHTIHTVFFITVRTVMTLLIYCNEENRTNRVVSLLLARNSFDPF